MNRDEVISELNALKSKLRIIPSKRYSNSLNYYAKKNFGSWNRALKAAGFKTKITQKAKLPDASPNLYYFLGLLYTDGHIVWQEEKRNYQIQMYTSYPEELRLILKLFNTLFYYKPFVRRRKMGFNRKINYSIHMCSKEIIAYLKEMYDVPIGPKAKRMLLPKLNSNDCFWPFLRGVIDGDGSISKNITLFSASKNFLLKITQVLQVYGFNVGALYARKRKSITYSLSMYRQTDLKRLYDLIYKNAEFFYPRKRKSFETMLKSFKNQDREILQSRLSSYRSS
jgi:intein/homing endonuclease